MLSIRHHGNMACNQGFNSFFLENGEFYQCPIKVPFLYKKIRFKILSQNVYKSIPKKLGFTNILSIFALLAYQSLSLHPSLLYNNNNAKLLYIYEKSLTCIPKHTSLLLIQQKPMLFKHAVYRYRKWLPIANLSCSSYHWTV